MLAFQKKASFSIALALIGGLGIIFLLAHQASSNFTVALEKARSDNLHLTYALDSKITTLIREVDLTLGELTEHINPANESSDEIRSHLASAQKRIPQVDNFAIINRDGHLSMQLHLEPELSLEQDFFPLLELSQHQKSIHASSNESAPSILIGHRLNTPSGDSLLIARINQRYLQAFLPSWLNKQGQAIYLLDSNYKVIAQYPKSAPALKPSPETTARLKAPAKSAITNPPVHQDSAAQLISFYRIANSPLIIASSYSSDVYLSGWKKSVVYYILAGALMLLLTLMMAFYFWRSQRLTRRLKAKEQKLSASETRFRQMIETTPVGLVLVRMPDFFITYINQPAAKMFGWPQAAALSKRAHELYYDRIDFIHHSDDALAGRPVNNAECILKHREGNPFWANVSMSATASGEGTTLVIGLSDITQRKRLEEELKRRATTDSLSGLANRAHFMESAQQEIARAKRYQHAACLLMLDIDFFKKVNDQYGHQTGDTVIKTMANLCRSTLRDNDLLARIGGEEFTALLPETYLAEAYEVAERLRKNIESNCITLEDGREIRFTTSIGISELQPNDASVEAPLKRADEALYASKHNGRNQTSCFEHRSNSSY